ncbi:MAG: hypothetical protein ACLKAK_10905 [Alkaliphilus sp.]
MTVDADIKKQDIDIDIEISKIRKYKLKTYEDYKEDVISRSDYIKFVARYNSELASTMLLREKEDKREQIFQRIMKWIKRLEKHHQVTLTKKIALFLFEEIILYRGKTIEVKLIDEEEIKAIGIYIQNEEAIIESKKWKNI